MYVYALAQAAPPPAPMIWKKGGGGEGKGEEAGGGAGGYAGDRAQRATAGIATAPLGGAFTPAAPVGPRPRHSQRLPAADR